MKSLLLTLLLSFSAIAYDPTVKNEFNVKEVARTDILFVMDNSGSMDQYQQLLAGLSDNLLKQFGNVDFKITAISTDKADPLNTLVIDRSSADPIKDLANLMTSFGTAGDATELVFNRTKNFLMSSVGRSFMRSNTSFEVIVVTDEEEQSPETVEEMAALSSLKKLAVSAFLPLGGCNPGPRNTKIDELVKRTGGMILDLCKQTANIETDYEALAKAMIKRAVSKAVPLSSLVIKENIDINSIRVYYGSQIIERGLLHTGWVFDVATNTIYLGRDIILGNQPVGTKFTIQYEIID